MPPSLLTANAAQGYYFRGGGRGDKVNELRLAGSATFSPDPPTPLVDKKPQVPTTKGGTTDMAFSELSERSEATVSGLECQEGSTNEEARGSACNAPPLVIIGYPMGPMSGDCMLA